MARAYSSPLQGLCHIQRGFVIATSRSRLPRRGQGDDFGAEALDSHVHSELVVATQVHEAALFLQGKTLDAALGRVWRKDFTKVGAATTPRSASSTDRVCPIRAPSQARVAACFEFETSLDLPLCATRNRTLAL